MNPIAGRVEHGERGIDILALEIAIEGVGEQDDVSTVCPAVAPDIRVFAKQSARHFGKLRCALKPAIASDSFAAPGTTSRRFNSQCSRAA